jgi:hypothetical protein
MRCLRLLLAGILSLNFVSALSAEPIVIDGGSFTTDILPPRGGTFGFFAADGSAFEGRWPVSGSIAAAVCNPCRPGTVISPIASFFTTDVPFPGAAGPFPTGSATIGSVSYPPPRLPTFPFVTFNGDLSFTGSGIALPAGPPTEFQLFILNLPFIFSGVLNGYDIFRLDPLLLFSAELYGIGTAHVSFTGSAFNQFSYLRTEYEFQPVPEPATLTMLLVGAGVSLGRRRSRKRI